MTKLPAEFSHLESWSAWCLATETERNRRRVSLGFEEISAFADAMLPDVERVCDWIDTHKAGDGTYDEKTLNLFNMLLSLAEVAPAIESYDPEVVVVDGYDTALFVADEKHKLRPAI
ncbi:MAG: hypothetical protein QM656_16090 [Paracoccaceae bacterium]